MRACKARGDKENPLSFLFIYITVFMLNVGDRENPFLVATLTVYSFCVYFVRANHVILCSLFLVANLMVHLFCIYFVKASRVMSYGGNMLYNNVSLFIIVFP